MHTCAHIGRAQLFFPSDKGKGVSSVLFPFGLWVHADGAPFQWPVISVPLWWAPIIVFIHCPAIASKASLSSLHKNQVSVLANCSKPQPLIYWQEWLFFSQAEKNYVLFLDLCFLDVGKQCRRATLKHVVVLQMTQHIVFQNRLLKNINLWEELHSGTRTSLWPALHWTTPLQGCQDGSWSSRVAVTHRLSWSGALVQIGQISSAESQSMIVISAFFCKVYLDEI